MIAQKNKIIKKAWWIIRDWKLFYAVQRNQYNDISLPKWHIEEWETPEQTALREVLEETWFECEILSNLWTIEYLNFEWIVQVQYFAMHIKKQLTNKLFPDVDSIVYGNSEHIANQLSYITDKKIFEKWVKFFNSSI